MWIDIRLDLHVSLRQKGGTAESMLIHNIFEQMCSGDLLMQHPPDNFMHRPKIIYWGRRVVELRTSAIICI